MNIELLIKSLSELVVGWPLMILVVTISLIYTVALRGIQFRHFFTAWKATLCPSQKGEKSTGELSPFQAFIGTLNSNLGNGSIAGIGTAIFLGGPGAALWVMIFSFILMAIRFAEVYISALYSMRSTEKVSLGGPMLYLRDVAGGYYLPTLYAINCLTFGVLGGCCFQANSMSVSLATTWGISPFVTAGGLGIIVLYILLGGADRIAKMSLAIVPVKVIVFTLSTLAILLYYATSLPAALSLIVSQAFCCSAVAGGVAGFSLQNVIRAGMTSSIFATESGLGSAAILFGSTGTTDPIQSGLMGMVSTFISSCAGFIVALCIVVSGVWDSGLNSTALTIASFSTVFGSLGGWIVSFLSISFGFGVLVSYAFIARSVWFFLTNGRCSTGFVVIYTACAVWGAVANVVAVWDLINIALAGTLLINMYGLLLLLPKIRPALLEQLRYYRA